jgi:hypothetical protein
MDQIIFLEYLNKLDKRFETEKRKFIVFIDNCRAHPPQDNLKHMKALKVVFFPPNITSVCQPMDIGIIAKDGAGLQCKNRLTNKTFKIPPKKLIFFLYEETINCI